MEEEKLDGEREFGSLVLGLLCFLCLFILFMGCNVCGFVRAIMFE